LLLYCLSKRFTLLKKTDDFRIGAIFGFAFLTTSLYWHTISFLAITILIAFFLSILFYSKDRLKIIRQNIPLFLFSITATLIIWINFRENSALAIGVSSLFSAESLFNWDTLMMGLFSGGSFVSPEYVYNYDFFISEQYISIPRYLCYILAYLIIAIIIFYPKQKKPNITNNKLKIIITILFVSDLISKIFHYLVTRTVATDIWTLFFPLIFGLTCSSLKFKKSSVKKMIILIIVSLFVYSTITTAAFSIYISKTQSSSYQTSFDTYVDSYDWLSSNLPSNSTKLLSDATTAGYFQIIYTMNKLYGFHIIKNLYIDPEYYNIVNGTFNMDHDTILALNLQLYYKHLTFTSLLFWNVFKPIAPECITANHFEVLYNNGLIAFLQ
jgi:hypothetical protein